MGRALDQASASGRQVELALSTISSVNRLLAQAVRCAADPQTPLNGTLLAIAAAAMPRADEARPAHKRHEDSCISPEEWLAAQDTRRIGKAVLDLGLHLPCRTRNGVGHAEISLLASCSEDLHEILDEATQPLGAHLPLVELVAVRHRVVQGWTRPPPPLSPSSLHSRRCTS